MATAVIMNGHANHRNWPEPNCRRESASQLRVHSSLRGLCSRWKTMYNCCPKIQV